jgi:FAD/FMN-containing dehydrogenase/ferredoxin
MSWKEYLMERARKTANRRKRTYGIEPAPRVGDLLMQESPSLSFRETRRLLSYILFKSPQRRLELLWKYITDKDTPVRRQQIESLAQDLRPNLSEDCHVAINYFERRNYSRDLARVPAFMEKILHRTTPSLVVQPKTEKDISSILKYCNSKKLAVFPRGSGSFAFGGAVPTRNGVVMDLSPMMAVLEVDPKTQNVRVQPGARWADVATHLEPYGLVPQTTPTSRFSTVAGWISTGGMGLDSYAYGSAHESVIAVRVARPNGSIVELNSKDESIKDLFGTEGQFGILTEITLRVRPKPGHSGALLLTFDDPGQAFEFIDELTNGDLQPSHVVFFDRKYLERENILFAEQTQLKDSIVPENDTVLLHFDTPENEQKFMSFLNGNSNLVSENGVAARYLWADRYFPLKAQRIGPGLLGSEVVIPKEKILKYVKKVEKLARHFNIESTVEVIVCGKNHSHLYDGESISKNRGSYSYLLIVSFSCDYSRTVHYVLSLLFIQLLVRMAVNYGGAPYGVGIWNTPFITSKYSRSQLNRLRQKKHEIDPKDILNPNKFFKIKGRFFSIPSLILHPVIFRPILVLSHLFAPILGLIARLTGPEPQSRWDIPTQEGNLREDLLHQSAQRCTLCGACISVCPAYHITEDELVTGRTKLRMAEAMKKNVGLCQEEAHAPFQCLHCGLCEEVCQTHLPLRDCYLVLEDLLENRFGSPAETVQSFVEKLDSRREFIKDIFGLDLPDWSPEDKLSRVPVVDRPVDGGKA